MSKRREAGICDVIALPREDTSHIVASWLTAKLEPATKDVQLSQPDRYKLVLFA